MPKYFPGYDAYLWMDADTWVQTPEALEVMLAAAAKDLAGYTTSEDDLAYRAALDGRSRYEMYVNCFADDLATAMQHRAMLCAGFFAMSVEAPHWQLWHQTSTEQLGVLPEVTQTSFHDGAIMPQSRRLPA